MALLNSASDNIKARKSNRLFQTDRTVIFLMFAGAFGFHLAILFDLLPS